MENRSTITIVVLKQPYYLGTEGTEWRAKGYYVDGKDSAEGEICWPQLDSYDPACGDDSGACDWDSPTLIDLGGVYIDLTDRFVRVVHGSY